MESIGSFYRYAIVASIITACIASGIETDIYVPSFPDMIQALGSSETGIQQILSLNFLGIFFGGLIFGPLSDRFEQRKVLLSGVGIFALASLGCFLAPTFRSMLLARFFQGLGAGSINTVALSIIFGLFDSKRSVQITAFLSSVCTVMMALAPLAGSFINIVFGWRASFLLILCLVCMSWLGMFVVLPGRNGPKIQNAARVKDMLLDVKSLLLDRGFLLKTFIRVAMFSCLFIYTAHISILFIEHIGVSEQVFGFYQASTMGCFCFFSMISAFLIGVFGTVKVKNAGVMLYLLGGLSLVLVSFFAPRNPALIALSVGTIGAGIGLANSVYFALAIQNQRNKGAAIAMTQSLGYLLLWGVIEISRHMFNGTIGSVTVPIVTIMASVLVCIYTLSRVESKKSTKNGPLEFCKRLKKKRFLFCFNIQHLNRWF